MTYLELMESAAEYIEDAQPKANSSLVVANIMRPVCKDLAQETFFVLTLTTKYDLIKIHAVTKGLSDRSHVHAREVFRVAILDNACAVVLCHNHPSGDPKPSSQDITITENLVKAGEILGIEVLDHVIMGKKTTERHSDYISVKEDGRI